MDYKEPIRLRGRKLSTGRTSLYLDIYLNGKRSYEYLNLYLEPETSRQIKEHNKQTWQLAEAVKAKRVVALRNGEFGFENPNSKKTPLIPFVESIAASKTATGTKICWGTFLFYLKQFCDEKTLLQDITPQWVQKYKDFLNKPDVGARIHKLSHNTKSIYFGKLNAVIVQGMKQGLIDKSPMATIEKIPLKKTERTFLTLEEVQRLAKTPIRDKHKEVRRAFLFSCLTGLRKSDIIKLTWREVIQTDSGTKIIFRQQKTQKQEYLDISPQAEKYLGSRGEPDDTVFHLSNNMNNYVSAILRRWAKDAGIDRPITFHSARHTFAVMMLELDVDIYTVSKLLGHSKLETTQVYAHMLDKKKQNAVNRIPEIG